MTIFAGLFAALPKLLGIVNMVLDLITAEKLKQAGINEQVLVQMQAQEEVRKAADHARKNPPSGHVVDHL